MHSKIRKSDMVHVRIDIENNQFKTENMDLNGQDLIQWDEMFSCQIDLEKRPPIKVPNFLIYFELKSPTLV